MVFSLVDARRRAAPAAVVLGTGEIASAVAVHLHRAGWSVVLSHDPHPPVLRRAMAFHDALWGDPATVDGVSAVVVERITDLLTLPPRRDEVAITRMGLVDLMITGRLDLLVDARLLKQAAVPDLRHLAEATIGLGPGFVAGGNCDVAVETRPAVAGRRLIAGATAAADGVPPPLGEVGAERFLRAPEAGAWRTALAIGTRVYRGMVAGHLGRRPLTVPMDGWLRGLVRDATEVAAEVKLVEIDPRDRWRARWTGIDERGRAIAEATAAAALDLRAAPRPASSARVMPFVLPPTE